MIDRILDLIKKNNINAKTLVSETGLPYSSITEWKKGRAKPSTEAIIKIAEYFEVSTDYILLGKEGESSLSDNEKDLLKIFRELKTEKQQDRFLGKAEMLIKEMTELDHKTETGA